MGCAIEVHRQLGPGLLESVYEKSLCFELRAKN
jgi:GxxExxY protein